MRQNRENLNRRMGWGHFTAPRPFLSTTQTKNCVRVNEHWIWTEREPNKYGICDSNTYIMLTSSKYLEKLAIHCAMTCNNASSFSAIPPRCTRMAIRTAEKWVRLNRAVSKLYGTTGVCLSACSLARSLSHSISFSPSFCHTVNCLAHFIHRWLTNPSTMHLSAYRPR